MMMCVRGGEKQKRREEEEGIHNTHTHTQSTWWKWKRMKEEGRMAEGRGRKDPGGEQMGRPDWITPAAGRRSDEWGPSSSEAATSPPKSEPPRPPRPSTAFAPSRSEEMANEWWRRRRRERKELDGEGKTEEGGEHIHPPILPIPSHSLFVLLGPLPSMNG